MPDIGPPRSPLHWSSTPSPVPVVTPVAAVALPVVNAGTAGVCSYPAGGVGSSTAAVCIGIGAIRAACNVYDLEMPSTAQGVPDHVVTLVHDVGRFWVLSEEVDVLTGQLEVATSELVSSCASVVELTSSLVGRDAEVSALKSEAADHDVVLGSALADVERQAAVLNGLEAQAEARDRQIAAIRASAAQMVSAAQAMYHDD